LLPVVAFVAFLAAGRVRSDVDFFTKIKFGELLAIPSVLEFGADLA
jgi:hypothetical protein